jgi:hypothetical protein
VGIEEDQSLKFGKASNTAAPMRLRSTAVVLPQQPRLLGEVRRHAAGLAIALPNY